MNQAEIMTLRNAGVSAEKIRIAIMAGKLSSILHAADRAIDNAEHFNRDADWTEMLRVMEGTLDKFTEHRTEGTKRRHPKDNF